MARYHPFTWFFFDASIEKSRVLRYMTLLKSILLSIFISTIFFSIYYPVDTDCGLHSGTTSVICLAAPSKLLTGTTPTLPTTTVQ